MTSMPRPSCLHRYLPLLPAPHTPPPLAPLALPAHVRGVCRRSAQEDCDVPLELAFALWEDRERIPHWMPWITSVVVQPDDATLSRWTLSTHQFGRQWEFSWLALNMAPLRNQKLHWRSVPGSTGGSLGGGLDVQNRCVLVCGGDGGGGRECTVMVDDCIAVHVPELSHLPA